MSAAPQRIPKEEVVTGVKRKPSPASTNTSSAASSSASSSDDLTPEELKKLESAFLSLFDRYQQVSQQDIQEELERAWQSDSTHSKITLKQVVQVINSLSKKSKVLHFSTPDGIVWKLNTDSKEEMKLLRNLSPEEKVIYQFIEREKNTGIWIRDLRKKTNLQPNKITKIIRSLMSRKLIKSEQSIAGKNKKVYMLYDLEPSKSVTGGAWYKGHEMDTEFINTLQKACRALVRQHGPSTAQDILEHVQASGISVVPITVADISCVLNVLWMDKVLDKCVPRISINARDDNGNNNNSSNSSSSSSGSGSGSGSSKRQKIGEHDRNRDGEDYDDEDLDDDEEDAVYKIANPPIGQLLPSIPCTVCPVQHKCGPGLPVNPEQCLYMQEWLQF
jgi:DNA-directed RNA polymerase III subunit RPC6